LKTLLIGDNSFIGVSHLSQERARERIEKLDVKSVVEIIETAVSCGATGYTFSTHPVNMQILKALRDSGKIADGFGLYPMLPYAQGYVRLANEKGMRGLVDETLSRLPLSDKAKAVFKSGFSALRVDPPGMLKAYIDVELAAYLSEKPGNASLQGVLLHEVVTDLCLGLRDVHLLDAFAQHIRQKYHASPGFVTYNLVRFVELFRKKGLTTEDVVIMTPFNSIGYQMSPSRHSCETCLSGLPNSNLIAMSIMAGGYLKFDEAVDYIRSLPNLSGVAVGVSSKEHACSTFTQLKNVSCRAVLS
jgi:hypothetical protein